MSQTDDDGRFGRRRFLTRTALGGAATLGWASLAGAWPGGARAQGLRPITASHSVSTFVYGQHLVAAQKRFFEEEGLKTPDFVVPGGGAKVVQALAAGQAMVALGDSNHPLKITEKGRDALMIFPTDTRGGYAKHVVGEDPYDKGVTSGGGLARPTPVARRAVGGP